MDVYSWLPFSLSVLSAIGFTVLCFHLHSFSKWFLNFCGYFFFLKWIVWSPHIPPQAFLLTFHSLLYRLYSTLHHHEYSFYVLFPFNPFECLRPASWFSVWSVLGVPVRLKDVCSAVLGGELQARPPWLLTPGQVSVSLLSCCLVALPTIENGELKLYLITESYFNSVSPS